MSDPICPFCGRDPFHYVDNGVGMEAVAVTCCDLGDMFFRGARPDPKTIEMSWEEFRDIGHRLLSTSASERGLREALPLAVAALEEAEAILGGEYGDQHAVLCERMADLRAALHKAGV